MARFESATGLATVEVQGSGVLLLVLSRHIDAALLQRALTELTLVVSQRSGIRLFIDGEGLETYESEVRKLMTEWIAEHRTRLAAVHGLHRSRLVAMATAIANLALRGFIQVHNDRAAFNEALLQAGGTIQRIDTKAASGVRNR